jgi:uncharacterized protein YjiS (DUF1127 family)
MAHYELGEFTPERCSTGDAPGVLARTIRRVRLWLLRRRTAAALSRLDGHLLRDIGFEQADAYDPLNGGTAALWKRAQLVAPVPLPSAHEACLARPNTFNGEDLHDQRHRLYALVHRGSGA